MKKLDEKEKKEICQEYINGFSIKELYGKHKIGDRRIRQILIDNGIEIKNSHQKTTSTDDYIEKVNERFTPKDGYTFIAVSKQDGTTYDDYLNKSGALTAYIKKVLKIEVPSLFKRKKYFHDAGMQWYEQFFDIIEVVDQEKETKKCPYCNWETVDIMNRSGMFETHLLKEHNITKLQYLEEHPEDRDYFALVNKTKDRKMETDNRKFVCCAICGEKYARLDWRHLAKHGITKTEYISKYGWNTVSNELHDTLSKITTEMNKEMKPTFVSKPEFDISEYIRSFGIECENNNRHILDGKELDIYLPFLKIGIEYNGLRWHSDDLIDKNKHLLKTELCKKKGVRLIHIFEDEYFLHRELVYEKIKQIIGFDQNTLNVTSEECVVKEIKAKEAKIFLEEYDMMGFHEGKVYLGAFYKDKAIAMMTFKQTTKDSGKWELTRFASDYHYVCQGVGGKLFKYFVTNYNPQEIKSFADRRWTIDEENNIYTDLGFVFSGYTEPDYKYYSCKIDRYCRFSKSAFKKKILHKKYNLPLNMTESEMAKELKLKRIWDCGLVKYVWKRDDNKPF